MLRDVELVTSGTFKCEVITEAPVFHTQFGEGNMTVIGESEEKKGKKIKEEEEDERGGGGVGGGRLYIKILELRKIARKNYIKEEEYVEKEEKGESEVGKNK